MPSEQVKFSEATAGMGTVCEICRETDFLHGKKYLLGRGEGETGLNIWWLWLFQYMEVEVGIIKR